MATFLDTHVLVWAIGDLARLSVAARERIVTPGEKLQVSAITAFEYADLHTRGRLPRAASLDVVRDALEFTIVELPSDLWTLAASLPDIHRDPVDRMLIAHAIKAEATLVTADGDMRRYPVRSLW